MGQLSTFIIMLVVFMMFLAGGMASLMSSLNDNYEIGTYNESDIDFYNKLDEISQDSQEIKNSSMELKTQTGITDILGNFFKSAYGTIKVAVGSFEVFDVMKDRAIDDSQIPNAEIYKNGLTIIAIVAIFLGIVIAMVVKWKT